MTSQGLNTLTNISESKRFIRKVLSPLVAVCASNDLDELCQSNQISSFTQLLQPFGVELDGKVSIRDSRGSKKSHSQISVRFANLKSLEPCATINEDNLLNRNLSDLIKNQARSSKLLVNNPIIKEFYDDESNANPNTYRKEGEGEDGPIITEIPRHRRLAEALLKVELEELTPWFNLYRSTFFGQIRLTEHETFDHPVACVIATTAHNASPLEALAKLYEQNSKLGQHNFVDQDILFHYVLIHDARRGNFERSQDLFDQIRKRYGTSCSLVVTNSRIGTMEYTELDPPIPDIWSQFDYQNPSETAKLTGARGQFLSIEDVDALKGFVRKFITESVIPTMERNVHLWNEQVASSRRGFTGRLFSASRRYFGTSKPNSTSTSPNSTSGHTSPVPTLYPSTSQEAQLRKLADYGMMLRDYEFARSTYEAVKKDFQADNAWKFYAGAQEMIGLCLLFSEGTGARIDVERYYDKAIHYYLSMKMTTWAARCALMYHALFKHHHRYYDIPLLMVRVTGEDSDLRSALFLEQAGYGYLRTVPSRVRKFAFHLILAGHRYNKCNQREHAYHCYQLASKMFNIHQPDTIHLLPTPPPSPYEVNDKKWNLVEDHISFSLGRQSFHLGELQQAILHFKYLFHQSGQGANVQLGYMKEFLYIYKNYVASTGHELLMEPSYQLPMPTIDMSNIKIQLHNTNLDLDGEFGLSFGDGDERLGLNGIVRPNMEDGVKVIGMNEQFNLELQLHNPLAIPLTATELSLNVLPFMEPSPIIMTSPTELTLPPQITTTLTFAITPTTSTTINLAGLYITINSHLKTYLPFLPPRPRLNNTPQQRRTTTYGENTTLKVKVIDGIPNLQCHTDNLPAELISGQVMKSSIKIKNCGEVEIDRLGLKYSHPTFVAFEDDLNLEAGIVSIENTISDKSTRPLFLKEKLLPGQETDIPIWIRGDRVGRHRLKLLLRVGSEMDDKSGLVRQLQVSHMLDVRPSIKISAFTRPSNLVMNQYVLGLEVENVHQDYDFKFIQLASISKSWRVESLTQDQVEGLNEPLNPSTTVFRYYLLTRSKPLDDEGLDLDGPEALVARNLQALTFGTHTFGQFDKIEMECQDLVLDNELPCNPFWSHPTSQMYLASRTLYRSGWLAREMQCLSESAHSQVFPLFNSHHVDLCLFWRATSPSDDLVMGHHYIIGIDFSVQQNPLIDTLPPQITLTKHARALFESTAVAQAKRVAQLLTHPRLTNQCPVRALLKFPDIIYHDFYTNPMCKIQVEFELCNLSWNRMVIAELILGESTDEKSEESPDVIHTQPTAPISPFTQYTTHTLHIPANSATSIHTFTSFHSPGTYTLSQWSIKVQSNAATLDPIAGTDLVNLLPNIVGQHHIEQTLGQVREIDTNLGQIKGAWFRYTVTPTTPLFIRVVQS